MLVGLITKRQMGNETMCFLSWTEQKMGSDW